VPAPIEEVVAPLLDRIHGWTGRATIVGPLEGGITNRNVLVDVAGDGRFVVRLAGKDTHLLEIDRRRERWANTQAAALGLAPAVHAFLEPEGYLVTRFVEGAPIPVERMSESATLGAVALALRAFHDSPPIDGDFDCFRVPFLHLAAARSRGVAVPARFHACAERAGEIEAAFSRTPEARVPCHNDLLGANFLERPGGVAVDGIWLLDWEYAGMNDRFFDLGNFSTNNELTDEAEATLVAAYHPDGAVTARRLARLRLMKVMSDFREAMWGVVQQGISTLDFDYVEYAGKHFDRLLRQASAPSYHALLSAAAERD
jgi:thiamine kinase-like enzyme